MRGLLARRLQGDRPRTDLSDEAAVRRRRARLTGWFILLGGLANASLPFSGGPGVGPQPRAAPLILAQLALTVLVFRRGGRITDRQFTVVQLATVAIVTPLVILSTARGSLRSAELVLIVPLLIGVVFCATRLEASVVAVACGLGAVLVTMHRIIDIEDMVSESVGELTCFVLLALTVRGLRDSAYRAVVAAKRGEITDPLTGLPNRRGFERLGSRTWERRAQDRQAVALLVLDVDHFKAVNDTYGHAAGDELLRSLAQFLATNARSSDVVVRLGGEEFAVLVPAEPGEGALIAEMLRQRIESELAPLTVSIGVVESVPDPVSVDADARAALWQAVAAADSRLYEAKRGGRNRVVGGSAEFSTGSPELRH